MLDLTELIYINIYVCILKSFNMKCKTQTATSRIIIKVHSRNY